MKAHTEDPAEPHVPSPRYFAHQRLERVPHRDDQTPLVLDIDNTPTAKMSKQYENLSSDLLWEVCRKSYHPIPWT
jgi:hypothetical protein